VQVAVSRAEDTAMRKRERDQAGEIDLAAAT